MWQLTETEKASIFFLKDIFKIVFRAREGEEEGEKHQCVVASCAPATGDLAYNPGALTGN